MKQHRSASRQRGFAMIAILALVALMTAYLIAMALSPDAAGQVIEREQRNMNALREAKAALIAYAAGEQWQKYKGQATDQPGALPCPDIVHDGTEDEEGDSDCVLPVNSSLIGRLPFKAVGTRDLRDASGERLWYALSANFRKAIGTTIINSDTMPCDTPACAPAEIHLSVIGAAPANNVVAVLFAPGGAIAGQARSADSTSATYNNAANYLEAFSLGDGIHFTFRTPALPPGSFNDPALPPGTLLNDRLIVITQAELMAAVEPVVAARIERDIKPYITQNYIPNDFSDVRSWWAGGYPFAVPWGGGPGQPQDNYKGDATTPTARGLMPVTTEANFVMWDTSSISVTQLSGGTGGYGDGSLNIGPVDCSASTGSQISCRIDYPGGSGDRPEIRLQATLLNAGRAFVRAMASGNETVRDNDGNVRNWSNTTSPNPFTVRSTLQATGHGTIRYEGRLINAQSMENRATITIPVFYHAVSSSADPLAGWFIANQWYRQTYYAASVGWLPGGGTSCTAGGTCLTVNNLSGTTNNKRLILVFAGRALDGSTRPTNNLANYFEGQNLNPNDLIFEHRAGAPTTINDRVVVVAQP